MGVVTKYGTAAKDPSSLVNVDAIYVQGTPRAIVSKIDIANGDSSTSVFYVGKIPSNAIIDFASYFDHEAVTGVSDFDVGFINDPDALIDGADISSAGQKVFGTVATVATANRHKRAWELAALSSDPGGMLDIIATLKANASAAKSVLFMIRYVKAG